MKKMLKKIVMFSLCLLFMCSCTRKPEKRTDLLDEAAQYVDLLRNYEIRAKNPENTVDDEKFNAYLDEVFAKIIDNDFLDMHYSIVDYKKMGIEKSEVSLGEIIYGFDEENFNFFKGINDRLHEFDYSKLSYKQQITYDALEYSNLETLPMYFYYQFNFLFDEASNVPEDLISYFTDYTFYDQESIDDYLICLDDIDRYFDDLLAYTAAQAEDGYPMADEWIDYTQVEVCDSITNKTETNDLIVSFDDRIRELDFIDDQQKEDYIRKNYQLVVNEVLPAYQKIRDEIEKYRGKASSDDYRLFKMDKDYADYSFMVKASTNIPVEDMLQYTEDRLSMMEAYYLSSYYDEKSFALAQSLMGDDYAIFNKEHKETLEYLRTNLVSFFPDLGNVDYTVDMLDPDNAPNNVVAYYWPSPVDNLNQNIIRVNPNSTQPPFKTYSTLAHEGFPGHLYQNIYYNKTKPSYIRNSISFIGYTEGWAVYVEDFCYSFAGINDDFAPEVLFYEAASYFPEYSIIDMMYNYQGKSVKEIYEYFKEESIFNYTQEYVAAIADFVVNQQTTYIPYGVGSSIMFELCDKAKRGLGEKFDYISFHQAVLENGPLPFPLLETLVDAYITENQ